MSELRGQPLHANSSEAVTNNVRVEVVSQYAPEHSQPFQGEWFFHYTIRITNEGEDTVQLLTRHWIITDATGATEEVRGDAADLLSRARLGRPSPSRFCPFVGGMSSNADAR